MGILKQEAYPYVILSKNVKSEKDIKKYKVAPTKVLKVDENPLALFPLEKNIAHIIIRTITIQK